ncbi:MAG: general stress protein [Patescibacteria group bacterium]
MAEKGKIKMSVQEAGQKGGRTTSREYGPEFYHEIGTKGGRATSREYGPEFYHEIGTKGGQKVRDLIKKGEKAENKKRNKGKNKSEYDEW